MSDPPGFMSPTLGMGLIGQNSTFSEYGHVAYQIKGNHKKQQYGSNFFARRPNPTPTLGVKRSKINFFRAMSSYIKLKGITNAATWLANILPADPLYDGDQRFKIQVIQNIVLLHIKLKGIRNAAAWLANILLVDPPRPW